MKELIYMRMSSRTPAFLTSLTHPTLITKHQHELGKKQWDHPCFLPLCQSSAFQQYHLPACLYSQQYKWFLYMQLTLKIQMNELIFAKHIKYAFNKILIFFHLHWTLFIELTLYMHLWAIFFVHPYNQVTFALLGWQCRAPGYLTVFTRALGNNYNQQVIWRCQCRTTW